MTKSLVLGGIAQLARAPALQAGGLGSSPHTSTIFLQVEKGTRRVLIPEKRDSQLRTSLATRSKGYLVLREYSNPRSGIAN